MSDTTVGTQGPVLTPAHQFTNHHRNYTLPVARLYDLWNPPDGDLLARYDATTAAVQALLGQARQAGARVRAYGSGWSISTAPVTDGWLLNTRPLDLFFRVTPTVLHAGYVGDPAALRFLQCGNSISKLNALLKAQGRSLRATGASNGQTIAGAMSTGTHGSAIDVGTIPDYVVGLHVILGPDRHVWLERASRPVFADDFIRRRGAEPLRDDALFDAALVAFGAFGFIHGVTIETDESFLLELTRVRRPFDDALKNVLRTLDFSTYPLPATPERPFHFEARFNPYDIDGGAFLLVAYRRPFAPDYTPPAPGTYGPGDDVLAAIGAITDWLPTSIPLLSGLLALQSPDTPHPIVGTIGEIFTDTTTPARAAGSAIGVPLERSLDALDVILGAVRAQSFPGLVSLRFVPRARPLLAFTRFPRTCILDIDGVDSERTHQLYADVWLALEQAGIPHTWHWGKMLPLDAGAIRAAYGSALDDWLAARRTLLDPGGRTLFSSPYTDALGLSV